MPIEMEAYFFTIEDVIRQLKNGKSRTGQESADIFKKMGTAEKDVFYSCRRLPSFAQVFYFTSTSSSPLLCIDSFVSFLHDP